MSTQSADRDGFKTASTFNTLPTLPTTYKAGHLDSQQISQFFNEGYVIVRDFFSEDELQPCRDAIDELVDELANDLYDAGKITDLHKECGLFQRLTALDKDFPGANILMFKKGKFHKAFRDLWCNDRLLNMVEQVIGPDVAGHPVWNLRPKIPNNKGVVVPWHQGKADPKKGKLLINDMDVMASSSGMFPDDTYIYSPSAGARMLDISDSAYFSADSYDHMVVTTWIPFLDTNAGNGGMQVVKNGHHANKVANHTCCDGETWYVTLDEDEMERSLGVDIKEDVVTCDVPFGGFLLFHNLTPHRSFLRPGMIITGVGRICDDAFTETVCSVTVKSNGGIRYRYLGLPNVSNDVRWSIDLRWQSPFEKWGFYDIQEGVIFRSSTESDVKPDWQKFLSVNRKEVWQKRHYKEIQETDKFDTTVTGPWIGRWDLVNHNRHTQAFQAAIHL